MDNNMLIYAVRNSKNEWFRAKGYGGYGESWVSKLEQAKIYTKIAQARRTITYFANNNPSKLPIPQLIEFKILENRVLDESSRIAKAQHKKELNNNKQAQRNAKYALDSAQRALDDAQAKLAKLKGHK